MLIFGYIIAITAACIAVPVFFSSFYIFRTALASMIPRRIRLAEKPSAKIAILIPAHNEEDIIEKTTASLLADIDYPAELYEVIVIADNCSDSTSYLATFAGAEVIERTNEWKKGKRYALEYAFEHLEKKNFDIYLVLNAGASLNKDSLRFLDAEHTAGHVAMQLSEDFCKNKNSLSLSLQEAFDALENYQRQRGRDRLGFSAGLIGNGSALSADILKQIPFTVSEEHGFYEYYIKLIVAGEKVRFVCGRDCGYNDCRTKALSSTRDESKNIREFAFKLIKEAGKGSFTALDSLLSMLVPSVLTLIFSLLAILLAGVMLYFASELPGGNELFIPSLVLGCGAVIFLIAVKLSLILAMIQKKTPGKTWLALFLAPFILIANFATFKTKA